MALTDPQETTEERPTCCCYASGRVFYGVKDTVYFSQVMEGENIDFLNRCYQKNDPTAEQISDLLATDGGTIQIEGAVSILNIKPFHLGVAIYAKNGIWTVFGSETGFSATNFFVRKVSDTGCISAHSIVKVEDVQYYWSREGIFKLQINQFGIAETVSITEQTIQSFYNNIPNRSKIQSEGSYNRLKKQVEWFYTSVSQDDNTDHLFSHDRSLLLDVRTEGFFPQSYNSVLTQTNPTSLDYTALVGGFQTNKQIEDQNVLYLGFNMPQAGASQDYEVTILAKTGTDFKDGYNDGASGTENTTYPSAYLETGYETLGKPSNTKGAAFAVTHFKQTEENWIADGSGFTLDLQSSCKMRAKWDWNDTSSNGRWSPEQEVYRFRRTYTPSAAEPFDSGETVITTKNKVLGRGKAMSLRFEQQDGKDMQLLGYTVQWAMKHRL